MSGATSAYVIDIIRSGAGIERTVIEAALPIVLAPTNPEGRPDVVPLAGIQSDLEIHADVLELRGDLQLPGCNVTIIARRVIGSDNPSISVDGEPGEAPQEALAKGVESDGIRRVAKGQAGLAPGARGMGRDEMSNEGLPLHAREMDGADGAPGVPGGNAGTITILADELGGKLRCLVANGGAGGAGQNGQPGADGGDGKDGRNFSHSPGSKAVMPTSGGDGGQGGRGGRGGAGGPGGNGGFASVFVGPGNEDSSVMAYARAGKGGPAGEPGQSGYGGSSGAGGAGGTLFRPPPNLLEVIFSKIAMKPNSNVIGSKPPGRPGAQGPDPLPQGQPGEPGGKGLDGQPGKATGIEHAPDALSYFAGLAAYVRPSHLQQCLNVARARWLDIADPTNQKKEDDAAKIFFRVFQAMQAWCSAYPDRAGPFERGLMGEAMACHTSYLEHLDPFGNRPNSVPLLTYKTYKRLAQEAADALLVVEAAAQKVYDAAEAKGDMRAAAQSMHDAAGSAIAAIRDRLDQEHEHLQRIQGRIGHAAGDADHAAAAVADSTATLREAIKSAFNLTPEQLFSGLSTMAFQAGSVAEDPGAAMQMGAQAGLLISEGSEQVISDFGEVVHKPYLLRSLRKVGGQNLKSELAARGAAGVDQGAILKSIADLKDVRKVFADFAEQLDGAADFLVKLGVLLQTLTRRNDLIYEYNFHAHRVFELEASKAQAEAQTNATGQMLLKAADPGLSASLSFTRNLHERVRAICLDRLVNLVRARNFYLLDERPLTHVVGDAPAAVTGAIANAAITEIGKSLSDSLEANRNPGTQFPRLAEKMEGERYATGFLVVLTRDSHPDVFSSLEFLKEATFGLLAPQPGSALPEVDGGSWPAATEAAVSDEKFEEAGGLSDGPHPFAGYGNVRLTRVRAFIEGIGTDGPVTRVQLRQLGSERLIRADGRVFPARGFAEHPGVLIDFHYFQEAFALGTDLTLPAKALEGSGIGGTNDLRGAAGFRDVDATYTGIGPFGLWQLRLADEENRGLDLSGASRVLIDFHAVCDHFD